MENIDLNAIMKIALLEGSQAKGHTFPNPAVGAVVVNQKGEVIGKGFHPKAGEPHAEVFAIQQALKIKADLSDCLLAVTLEPCNHQGRTPPCTDLILKSKVGKLVVGTVDANPKMRGKSLKLLTEAGVDVIPPQMLSLEMQKDCNDLVRGFLSLQKNARAFITLKAAVSLDGKVATSSGESKWITSAGSRARAHLERALHGAVLVGVETVLADNPFLTARNETGASLKSITRIILDSRLRTPVHANLFQSRDPVLIFCEASAPGERREALQTAGAKVISVHSAASRRLDLLEILGELAQRGICEVLVEGGAHVLGSFAKEGLFDRIVYFIAPKILGASARSAFEGIETSLLSESIQLHQLTSAQIGQDLVIEGRRI